MTSLVGGSLIFSEIYGFSEQINEFWLKLIFRLEFSASVQSGVGGGNMRGTQPAAASDDVGSVPAPLRGGVREGMGRADGFKLPMRHGVGAGVRVDGDGALPERFHQGECGIGHVKVGMHDSCNHRVVPWGRGEHRGQGLNQRQWRATRRQFRTAGDDMLPVGPPLAGEPQDDGKPGRHGGLQSGNADLDIVEHLKRDEVHSTRVEKLALLFEIGGKPLSVRKIVAGRGGGKGGNGPGNPVAAPGGCFIYGLAAEGDGEAVEFLKAVSEAGSVEDVPGGRKGLRGVDDGSGAEVVLVNFTDQMDLRRVLTTYGMLSTVRGGWPARVRVW